MYGFGPQYILAAVLLALCTKTEDKNRNLTQIKSGVNKEPAYVLRSSNLVCIWMLRVYIWPSASTRPHPAYVWT